MAVPLDGGAWHIADGGTWSYQSDPPAGGPHWPSPAPWGISTAPVPREAYVHNEEHGGVILVYNCDGGCPSVIQAFTELYHATPLDSWNEIKVVVTPDPLYQGGQFAAASWGYVYKPSTFDASAFRCFIDTHIDKGPENAP